MEDWILRTNVQEDWLSLIFIFNFALLVLMKRTNQNQFNALIRFIDSALYFKIYGKDILKVQAFNTLSTVFLLMNVSLGVFYYLTFLEVMPFSFSSFFKIFISLSSFGLVRFFFLQFCFWLLEISDFSNTFNFKSISHQIQIAIPAFFLFALHEFSFSNQKFFFISLSIIMGLYLLSQLALYREYWMFFKYNLLYLILYLCAFKLAPWLLFYNTLN